MAKTRHPAWLVLTLLTLAAGPAAAQEDAPKAFKKDPAAQQRKQPRDGVFPQLMHLVPPSQMARLNLTAEQREQVKKVEEQFNEKRKMAVVHAVLSVSNILQSLEKDEAEQEAAPALAIAHEVTGALLQMRRSRVAHERKFMSLLDGEQRLALMALRDSDDEREPRGRRERDRDGVQRAGYFTSPEGQEKLKITPEQRQKMTELRKEFETRLRDVLTAEQQRQLDDAGGRDRGGDRPLRKEERRDDGK